MKYLYAKAHTLPSRIPTFLNEKKLTEDSKAFLNPNYALEIF